MVRVATVHTRRRGRREGGSGSASGRGRVCSTCSKAHSVLLCLHRFAQARTPPRPPPPARAGLAETTRTPRLILINCIKKSAHYLDFQKLFQLCYRPLLCKLNARTPNINKYYVSAHYQVTIVTKKQLYVCNKFA